MSLDVYLTIEQDTVKPEDKIFIRRDGALVEITMDEWRELYPDREPVVVQTDEPGEVYWANITHNVNRMAEAAGIYKELWRPEEIGIEKAEQLIEPLSAGLERLRSDPDKYSEYNPPNGWGSYGGLVHFVEKYLQACKQYPGAKVYASR